MFWGWGGRTSSSCYSRCSYWPQKQEIREESSDFFLCRSEHWSDLRCLVGISAYSTKWYSNYIYIHTMVSSFRDNAVLFKVWFFFFYHISKNYICPSENKVIYLHHSNGYELHFWFLSFRYGYIFFFPFLFFFCSSLKTLTETGYEKYNEVIVACVCTVWALMLVLLAKDVCIVLK